MSKSMTAEQLKLMGLTEVSPGVYQKVKTKVDKAIELVDDINIATYKLQKMFPESHKNPLTTDEAFKDLIATGQVAQQGGVFVKTQDVVYNTFIFLVVKGDPTPQQRHRHHQVKGADFVSTYDPSAKAKKAFLKACLPYKPEKPYEQPLRVDMVFYFSRPKSHYRTGKYAHILKDTAPTLHVTRPDADNCAKFVKDSLNKTFWKDDSFVCDMNVKKRYDENPRTEITITPL